VTEIAITRAGAERIDDVQPPLARDAPAPSLRRGHLTAVPPFRSDDESWVRRRAFYERLLARLDSFFLLERRGLVPYLRLTIGRVPPAL